MLDQRRKYYIQNLSTVQYPGVLLFFGWGFLLLFVCVFSGGILFSVWQFFFFFFGVCLSHSYSGTSAQELRLQIWLNLYM